jgi:hypothetical protein
MEAMDPCQDQNFWDAWWGAALRNLEGDPF